MKSTKKEWNKPKITTITKDELSKAILTAACSRHIIIGLPSF